MQKQKHLIEIYNDYNIFIVSAATPFFIAEKDNPALGATLVQNSLDDLKNVIDANIQLLKKLKINTKQITPNKIVQNTSGVLKADRGHSVQNITIVLIPVYDRESYSEACEMNKNFSNIRHYNRYQKTR